MNNIRQYHIEHPTEQRTLCYLKAEGLWGDPNFEELLVTLEESVLDNEYIVEAHKCDICWRDDEERTLMLLAEV
jgi:hypothetical protein